MAFIKNCKGLCWLALACLVIAGISHWVVAPKILELPKDFKYEAKLFSKDNLYNEKEDRFVGEIISKTIFKYQVAEVKDQGLVINNVFDVRKPSGQKIFSVSRNYGINPLTSEHVLALGDQERAGYLFSPIPAPESNYTYWHINYNRPIEMQFLEKTLVEGLEVHHYIAKFQVDQSEELSFLPLVPESKGVELDVSLELFIEPITGHLIKYYDQALATYYDRATKKKLHPWNKFSNNYTFGSIIKHVNIAKQLIFKWRVFHAVLPLILLFICIAIVIYRWWKIKYARKGTVKPKFFAALLLITGLAITLLVFCYLLSLDKESKINQAELVSHNIWVEIQNQIETNVGVLNMLRFNAEVNKTNDYQLFKKISQHAINKNGTIHGLSWIPLVENQHRISFEKAQQKINPAYKITERNSSNNLVLASSRPKYYPVTYMEPFEPNKAAIGFDLGSNQVRLKTILFADSIKDYAITPPIKLVQETDNAKSILIMNPVFDKNQDGSLKLIGLYNGIFRIPNLVSQAIAYLDIQEGIGFKLIDVSDDGSELLYEYAISNESSPQTLAKTLSLSNRLWKLEIYAYPQFLEQTNSVNYFVLVIGFILTLASTWLFYREETDNRKELIKINKTLSKSEESLQIHTNQLKKSNLELEQFAYIASHDLQEPLRSINILSEMIYERHKNIMDEESTQDFTRLKAGITRMHQLIQDILEYSKVGGNKTKEPIDLNSTVEGVKHDLNALILDTKTELIIENLPIIKASKVEMQQLFANLITNSVKFRKQNEPCKIFISTYETDTHHCFNFKDNGIGIAPKHYTKIFNIFQRLHNQSEIKGTGIGLALCKKIVELHGGKIWVVSEQGVGSTFHFSISKNIIE